MTPKELREAAQHIVAATDGYIACGMCSGVSESVEAMARHILATVRDDDDEPVSEEWFSLVLSRESSYLFWFGEANSVELSDNGTWGAWKYDQFIVTVKTRGQLPTHTAHTHRTIAAHATGTGHARSAGVARRNRACHADNFDSSASTSFGERTHSQESNSTEKQLHWFHPREERIAPHMAPRLRPASSARIITQDQQPARRSTRSTAVLSRPVIRSCSPR